MKIVIALGGNAILQRGESQNIENQRKNIQNACKVIVELSKEHQIILSHGNGPQVGLLDLIQQNYKEIEPFPFDVLGAKTQGMIGYLLNQELQKLLPNKKIANILTMTTVSQNDDSFKEPTKFIGPIYTEEKIKEYPNWIFKKDGEHFRRVIASPKPTGFVQLPAIETLIAEDYLLICSGGGGIPVLEGSLEGIEAVIDKDLSSSLLAQKVGADSFLILTDVPGVYKDFQKKEGLLSSISADELSKLTFPAGSMLPKVQACCSFTKATKKQSYIGSLTESIEILKGNSGTQIF